MKRILFTLLLLFSIAVCHAQNFRGQWKGYFIDKTASPLSFGTNQSDYVLDLEVHGHEVSGYSYTYFTDGGKKYYTICTLTGYADQKAKTLAITETARTKTNVPVDISNSFQIHKLIWRKDGDNEILEGKWDPAPGQGISTGHGTTFLQKRQLTEISALAKSVNQKKDPASSPEKRMTSIIKPKQVPFTAANKVKLPVAKTKTPVTAVAKTPVKPATKLPIATIAKDSLQTMPVTARVTIPIEKATAPDFEKRSNSVLQTVNVENPSVKIELYDNGEVDGDSISLFYNGKVLLAHKRLSEKAITLELPIDFDVVNELVMYADNLGTIPPNTALMVVYDGTKRYEVRITSDLKKSGTIRFTHKSAGTN